MRARSRQAQRVTIRNHDKQTRARPVPDLSSGRTQWSLATSLVPPLAAVIEITGGLELTRTASVKIKPNCVTNEHWILIYLFCCFFFFSVRRPNLRTALFSCSIGGKGSVEMTIQFDCNWTGRSGDGRNGKRGCFAIRPGPAKRINAAVESLRCTSSPRPAARCIRRRCSGSAREVKRRGRRTRSPQRGGGTYFPAKGGAINIHLIYTPMYTCGIKEAI